MAKTNKEIQAEIAKLNEAMRENDIKDGKAMLEAINAVLEFGDKETQIKIFKNIAPKLSKGTVKRLKNMYDWWDFEKEKIPQNQGQQAPKPNPQQNTPQAQPVAQPITQNQQGQHNGAFVPKPQSLP